MKEIDYLRTLYLEDLGKIVNCGGADRPRIRHVGNWERLSAQVTPNESHEEYLAPYPH